MSSRRPGSTGSGSTARGTDVPGLHARPGSSADQLRRQVRPAGLRGQLLQPSFRFPRNLRLALGTDVALPWSLVGTADLLYIQGVDQFDITDMNLAPPTTTSAGEGGRLLYGTIDPHTGEGSRQPAEPNRTASWPRCGTRAETGASVPALSCRKQFRRNGIERGVHLHRCERPDVGRLLQRDLQPRLHSAGRNPGPPESQHLPLRGQPQGHDRGQDANLPLGFRGGLFYNGYTGQPYTYLVDGDANADGLSFGNDTVYVPEECRGHHAG